jgi:hypothetical protein
MNIEDLIGKKVRVRGRATTPGALSKIVDIVLEGLDILEEPIPDEPTDAARVEVVGASKGAVLRTYVYREEHLAWERTTTENLVDWDDLVRKARSDGYRVRVVTESTVILP